MDYETFRTSLEASGPPKGLDAPRQALWWDAKGDWDKAHKLADSLHDAAGCWVHAYLHRKEGDKGNARYWYGRAGKSMPSSTLDAEWTAIAKALLG